MFVNNSCLFVVASTDTVSLSKVTERYTKYWCWTTGIRIGIW